MLYTVLIYGESGLFERLPAEEQEAILRKHRDLQATLTAAGKLKSSVKLMAPSAAMNVRQQGDSVMVLDGPYAETKEQLLGFYLVDCETMEEALEVAKALPQGVARMEVRPVGWALGA